MMELEEGIEAECNTPLTIEVRDTRTEGVIDTCNGYVRRVTHDEIADAVG
jgi:hypothetical protein